MQSLLSTITAMQQSINALTQQLSYYKDKSGHEIPGAPRMGDKDLKEPSEYGGTDFKTWSEDFIAHLRRRDRRWAPLLKGIQVRSKTPLKDIDGPALMAEAEIANDKVLKVFAEQLYEYLRNFTCREPLTHVNAHGPDNAFEAWRYLCDQGAPRQDRDMRDERRKLWHPHEIKELNLMSGIEEWERKLAAYNRIKPDDTMSGADKIMALEDMCPVHLQKHLAMLEMQGVITQSGPTAYAQHKEALEQYFRDQKRWGKSKGSLNAATERPDGDQQPAKQDYDHNNYGNDYDYNAGAQQDGGDDEAVDLIEQC